MSECTSSLETESQRPSLSSWGEGNMARRKLRRDAVGNHLEFRYGVQQGCVARNRVPTVSYGNSVDEVLHAAGPAAVDAGVGSATSAAAVALDVARKHQQLQRIALHLRQGFDQVVVDDLSGLGVLRTKQRGLPLHHDGLRFGADLE